MRAPAQRLGDSAGCSEGSGSNSYAGSGHQERTDLRASAAVHHRPVSSGAGQTPPGGQLIPKQDALEEVLPVDVASHHVERGVEAEAPGTDPDLHGPGVAHAAELLVHVEVRGD